MAHSRTERIGTIFSRVTALWQNNAISQDNLPLWYDIYKTFPPKYEPRFDRPGLQKPVRKIFYKEDLIRSKFQKDVLLPIIDLKSQKISQTQLFCYMCDHVKQLSLKEEEEEAYNKVLSIYKKILDRYNKRT